MAGLGTTATRLARNARPWLTTTLTFRNLCRRKANQLVSIFSATDSVLGRKKGWEGQSFTEGSQRAGSGSYTSWPKQGIKGHRAGSQDTRAESVTLGQRLFLSGPQFPVKMEWCSGSSAEGTPFPQGYQFLVLPTSCWPQDEKQSFSVPLGYLAGLNTPLSYPGGPWYMPL